MSDISGKGLPGKIGIGMTPEQLQIFETMDDRSEHDRIDNALIKLFSNEPFYAAIMSQTQIHAGREAVGIGRTACVWIGNDLRLHMAFNPFFWRKIEKLYAERGQLPLDADAQEDLESEGYEIFTLHVDTDWLERIRIEHEVPDIEAGEWLALKLDSGGQIALIIHECLHFMSLHLMYKPQKYPIPGIANIAMDLEINQYIANLPDSAMTLDIYAKKGLELEKQMEFQHYLEKLLEFYGQTEPPEEEKERQPVGTKGDSMVTTPNGDIAVRDLKAGDIVWSFQGGKIVTARVVGLFKMKPKGTKLLKMQAGVASSSVLENTMLITGSTAPYTLAPANKIPYSTPVGVLDPIGPGIVFSPLSGKSPVTVSETEEIFLLSIDPMGNKYPMYFADGVLVLSLLPSLRKGKGEGEEGPEWEGPTPPPTGGEGGEGEPQMPEPQTGPPAPLDEHQWDDPPDGAGEVGGDLMREVSKNIYENAKQTVKKPKDWGSMPGRLRARIEEAFKAKVNWRRALRRWVGDHIRIDYESTRMRPHRRFPDQPGERGVYGTSLWVLIDVSGSVSQEERKQFLGELKKILDIATIILMPWDMGLTDVVKIRNRRHLMSYATEGLPDMGGTDFRNVLLALKKKVHPLLRARPDGMIVLTDGGFYWPERSEAIRGVPTLWGLTVKSAMGRAKWGREVFVDVKQPKNR